MVAAASQPAHTSAQGRGMREDVCLSSFGSAYLQDDHGDASFRCGIRGNTFCVGPLAGLSLCVNRWADGAEAAGRRREREQRPGWNVAAPFPCSFFWAFLFSSAKSISFLFYAALVAFFRFFFARPPIGARPFAETIVWLARSEPGRGEGGC